MHIPFLKEGRQRRESPDADPPDRDTSSTGSLQRAVHSPISNPIQILEGSPYHHHTPTSSASWTSTLGDQNEPRTEVRSEREGKKSAYDGLSVARHGPVAIASLLQPPTSASRRVVSMPAPHPMPHHPIDRHGARHLARGTHDSPPIVDFTRFEDRYRVPSGGDWDGMLGVGSGGASRSKSGSGRRAVSASVCGDGMGMDRAEGAMHARAVGGVTARREDVLRALAELDVRLDPNIGVVDSDSKSDCTSSAPRTVLGEPISKAATYASSTKMINNRTYRLPILVVHCVEELYRTGLYQPNLFRTLPNRTRLLDLIAIFDSEVQPADSVIHQGHDGPDLGIAVGFGAATSLHLETTQDICALLTSYVSALPEPVIPAALFDVIWEECVDETVSQTPNSKTNADGENRSPAPPALSLSYTSLSAHPSIQKAQLLLHILPVAHLSLFTYLLAFFSQVALVRDENGAGVDDLARMFGSRIFGSGEGRRGRRDSVGHGNGRAAVGGLSGSKSDSAAADVTDGPHAGHKRHTSREKKNDHHRHHHHVQHQHRHTDMGSRASPPAQRRGDVMMAWFLRRWGPISESLFDIVDANLDANIDGDINGYSNASATEDDDADESCGLDLGLGAGSGFGAGVLRRDTFGPRDFNRTRGLLQREQSVHRGQAGDDIDQDAKEDEVLNLSAAVDVEDAIGQALLRDDAASNADVGGGMGPRGSIGVLRPPLHAVDHLVDATSSPNTTTNTAVDVQRGPIGDDTLLTKQKLRQSVPEIRIGHYERGHDDTRQEKAGMEGTVQTPRKARRMGSIIFGASDVDGHTVQACETDDDESGRYARESSTPILAERSRTAPRATSGQLLPPPLPSAPKSGMAAVGISAHVPADGKISTPTTRTAFDLASNPRSSRLPRQAKPKDPVSHFIQSSLALDESLDVDVLTAMLCSKSASSGTGYGSKMVQSVSMGRPSSGIEDVEIGSNARNGDTSAINGLEERLMDVSLPLIIKQDLDADVDAERTVVHRLGRKTDLESRSRTSLSINTDYPSTASHLHAALAPHTHGRSQNHPAAANFNSRRSPQMKLARSDEGRNRPRLRSYSSLSASTSPTPLDDDFQGRSQRTPRVSMTRSQSSLEPKTQSGLSIAVSNPRRAGVHVWDTDGLAGSRPTVGLGLGLSGESSIGVVENQKANGDELAREKEKDWIIADLSLRLEEAEKARDEARRMVWEVKRLLGMK